MKKLLLTALAAMTFTVSRADNLVIPVTANVVSNLFANGKTIDSITVTATTTNITTFKFYDSSNTSTTIVRAAYQNWASYATNFSTVFTNEANLLVTNTFTGRWTYPTTVSAVTNSRPAIVTLVAPGSSLRTQDLRLLTLHGLNVIPDQNGIVEIEYRPQP